MVGRYICSLLSSFACGYGSGREHPDRRARDAPASGFPHGSDRESPDSAHIERRVASFRATGDDGARAAGKRVDPPDVEPRNSNPLEGPILKIDRILYPTDFSETARRALPWAADLARRFGAELHVLHALSLHAADPASLEGAFPIPPEVFDEWADRAEETLEETTAPAREEGLRVRQEVRRSIAPSAAILDYVDEEEIDLVVMGTHGRRGLRHLALGSVVEEVLRFSPCPVLAVRKADEEEGPAAAPALDRILVPVDFSDHSERALEYAAHIAREQRSHLDLLYVVEQVTYPDFYYPASPSREKMARQISGQAKERLERRVGDLRGGRAMTVDFGVEIGDPVDEIVERAEAESADLIVMGSHGRTGVKRVLLGSVAEATIRRAPCPVLVVRLGGSADEEG